MTYSFLYFVVVGLVLILGALVGYFARQLLANQQLRGSQNEAKRLLEEATAKHEELLSKAREEAVKVRQASEIDSRERRYELQRMERRFNQKEERLDRKLESVERRERGLTDREEQAEAAKAQLEEIRNKQLHQLELISGMSSEEAKQGLLQAVEGEIREEASLRVREWEERIKDEIDDKARDILATTIQRCATDVVSETTVSVVPLPSDEMKGRLIGREGRNIRAMEQATGVDLIIDDSPETVTISSFDPLRREIARRKEAEAKLRSFRVKPKVVKRWYKTEDAYRNAVKALQRDEPFANVKKHLRNAVGEAVAALKLAGKRNTEFDEVRNLFGF